MSTTTSNSSSSSSAAHKKDDDVPDDGGSKSSSSSSDTMKQLSAVGDVLQKIAKPAAEGLVFIAPIVIDKTKWAYKQYKKLPQNVILGVNGMAFCFFGGVFPTLFAAIQAAEYGGREKVMNAMSDITDEILIIIEESKKDDEKDDDHNGIPDVNEISSNEYVRRKTLLVLKKMDPDKIDNAVSSIYQVWLSVAAVLSLQFARTVSMALTIADFLNKPCDRFITPTLATIVPDEYDKWIPVILRWITKAIAMSFAWYIASVMYATASAMKGGLMISRAVYQYAVEHKMTMGGLIPENHEDSNIDEFMSYGFATCGFYFQFRNNFSLPTLFQILFFPLTIAEYYIRWSITSMK